MNPHPDLTIGVIQGLGWLYLLMFFLNVGWTVRSYKRDGHFHRFAGMEHVPRAVIWSVYAALLLLLAATHLTFRSDPDTFLIRLPVVFKNFVDGIIANPVSYFVLSMAVFFAMIWLRRWWVQPTVAWILFNLSVIFLALSMTDFDFRQIVGKPDNVPIVGMLYLVGFFTWLYFYKANENDRRIAEGLPVTEKGQSEQVLVWPDLVYSEMICMVLVSAFLILWGVALPAPLEEPASAVKTPNPSKAPWYFLGLQEMLVYFDPWMAGVVLPSVILVGLMAIPYIDFNRFGNGYYTFNQRKFAVITFLFGFLPLWVAMIVLGTFIRGPNWNMFGLYEYWDVHKLEVLNNVNLSDWFWLDQMKMPLPRPINGDSLATQVFVILKREWLGLLAVAVYLFVLPPLMAVTVFRSFFIRMGFIRYMVLANLVLFMAALPLKMVLRWLFTLKYIVAIPEWFFNI
ncbi:hypothetical protein SH661x_003116 [Planctomicrobium sp. SH661]|uniref:hypothetical protein n=1 Tax=Planctomicrobium sp. SH661 TaxID=3448124 RepID=UPI003F5BDC16